MESKMNEMLIATSAATQQDIQQSQQPPQQLEQEEPKVWSLAEKLILPVSLVLAILFDRMVANQIINPFVLAIRANDLDFAGLRVLPAVFWIGWLVAFYALFWKRICKDVVLWLVSACVVALSVWNFINPDGNFQFRMITFVVIPAVLMAHAQWTAGGFSFKLFDGAVIEMVAAWFEGWLVKPFTGLGAFFGVSASLVSSENRPVFKRALIGVLISVVMLAIIVPLLMGADQVFGYYVRQLFSQLSFFTIVFNGFVVIVAFGLFFSTLWNVGFGQASRFITKKGGSIDKVISSIVLSSVILVYILFCLVQFTYLFARAGLPEGMTFSEYAREGFAQTVAVCAINLIIFGVFLWRGSPSKLLTILKSALLLLTGIMLVSGALRLNLYIDAFGMTWLRLLSAWFIFYLAAVVVLCLVRSLLKKDMPLVAICSLILLVWYVALGFLNPDNFIHWYNYDFFLRGVVY
ncbi:MAG: DUF4173 domain-containing protein [Defluviitaleaceae bacterium]|nr:DUF4173 domain-containing protein [Defluviitaleaceae bacterium]